MSDGFLGLTVNQEGFCSFCSDPQYKNINWSKVEINEKKKKEALFDWNSIIESIKLNHRNQQYDCIIGYSGGKDSTALLDIFVSEYNLNPLAVTVDTGYMTNIAMENMKDTLEKINIDHIFIKNAIPTFTKLYKFHFLNHQSNEQCLTKVICDYCSDLLHSIVVKEAMKKEISFVLFGYSPDQIARYFYEMPQNEILNDWMPKFILNAPFTDEDRKWYINSKEIDFKKIPRVLLPFHVLKYQEDKIIDRIESKNLIKKGFGDPLKTNCNVVAAALFYDINRYGGIPYTLQYAELVRQDPSIRKKWLRTIKIVAPLILEGKFKEIGVNEFFDKIGVAKEEFLEYIRNQLVKDPNKEIILKNLNLIKRRIK